MRLCNSFVLNLFEFALGMIKKYGEKKGKLFPFIPYPPDKKYKDFRDNYNRSLRIISKDLELTSILKSKTTRYVFRSLAGELLISDLVVMQLQAHKATDVTFTYQRKLSNSVVDREHKKILDVVFV